MTDKPLDLSSLTNEELMAELARRASSSASDMSSMELAGEAFASDLKARAMRAQLEALEKAEMLAVSSACPKCGRPTPVKARSRSRKLVTMSGTHEFRRNYHHCGRCGHGFYPLDTRLGLPDGGELSAEVERRLLDFGLHDTFMDAAERWSMHYGFKVSENLLRRVVERVGRRVESQDGVSLQQRLLPREPEPAELLVVGIDGSMLPMRGKDGWREAKVAAIYRAEDVVRKPSSSRGQVGAARYAAVVGNPAELAQDLGACLAAERASSAAQAVVVGDGAPWIWRVAEDLLPEAHQVLDWWHVAKHVAQCSAVLLGSDEDTRTLWRQRAEELIWNGHLSTLIHELHDCVTQARLRGDERRAVEDLVRYLVNHEERLNYAVFREAGFPVGSGFVESAHRHVLQARMKRSGQRWEPKRAARMAKLRAALRTAGPSHLHAAIHQSELRQAA